MKRELPKGYKKLSEFKHLGITYIIAVVGVHETRLGIFIFDKKSKFPSSIYHMPVF